MPVTGLIYLIHVSESDASTGLIRVLYFVLCFLWTETETETVFLVHKNLC